MNQKCHDRGENRQDGLGGPVGPAAGVALARLVPRPGPIFDVMGVRARNAGQTLEIRIRVARIARVSSGSPLQGIDLFLSTLRCSVNGLRSKLFVAAIIGLA